MLFYNPYFAEMKRELFESIDTTSKVLDHIEKEQKDSKIIKDHG
jgi:hypothetical protein